MDRKTICCLSVVQSGCFWCSVCLLGWYHDAVQQVPFMCNPQQISTTNASNNHWPHIRSEKDQHYITSNNPDHTSDTYIGTYISMSIANNIIYSRERAHFRDRSVALIAPKANEKIWDCYLYLFVVYCIEKQQIASKPKQITDKQQINNRWKYASKKYQINSR